VPANCDADTVVIRTSTFMRDTIIRIPAGGDQCPCGDYVLFANISLDPYWKAESASPWEFIVPAETLPCGNITGVKCYRYAEGEYQVPYIRAPASNAPAANLIVRLASGAC
jgi:hypothetical protein